MPAGAGAHYAQYSFEPQLRILNGFVQSLVGLYDYGRLAIDDRAKALYAQGELRARQEVPTYDTGAWSLYSRGSVTHESDLGYHTLLRDFLDSLCNRTDDPVYCGARDHFTADLSTPPVLKLGDHAAARRHVLAHPDGDRQDLRRHAADHARATRSCTRATSARSSRGPHTLGWQVPRKRGVYTVELIARDLAGNPGSVAGPVEVLKPKKKKKRKPSD